MKTQSINQVDAELIYFIRNNHLLREIQQIALFPFFKY